MNNAGMVTLWTGARHFSGMTANMTTERIIISVQSERQITFGTKRLPAAFFAQGHRGRTTTIMKNESLMMMLKIIIDSCQELIGKIAIFAKISAITQINDGKIRRNGGGFSFFGEFDKGMTGLCEVIIDQIRCSGALKAGDFQSASDKTSEAEGGIARWVFLIIGGFVGLVDDDLAEVADGS